MSLRIQLCAFIFAMFAPFATMAYTVTYDCGGGTGTPPEDMVAYSGETFTPAANTCERQGYVFVGWGVSDTDGPDVVSDHEPFTWNYTTNKTFIARWACDTLSGYTMNPDTGQCVETYTATFDCEKQSSFYSNPNGVPFEKTVMYGESISMDQNPCQIKPSLVENFTCKGEISDWIYEPNQKWSYLVPGTTVNREAFRDDTNFVWGYHDDITFRPVNIIPGWTIRYYCGIAGGTPPAQSGINYNYCANIGIAAPTNCTTDPLLEFKGWSVIYNSNEVATIAPGVSRYTDGWWPGATTLVAQWQCADGSTWNSETGTCVQNTYTATFDCTGANGNFPFVNPEAGLESITGVREGSQVTLPSPQLCELRADLPACGKTSFAPRISAGNNHWRYDSGEAQPGDFLWPFNNDITFYLRGYNHSGVIVSYDCGVAGGTAPSNFTVNYSNCDSVTIAEPTECNQIQGASFYKWQVNTSAGKLLDPGPYDQDWNLGPAKLTAQWVCDNPKQVIVNGECVETYTATFYCDAMEDSPFQNPASGLEPITGIVLNDSVDLHSTALCEYKPNVPQCGREGYYQVQPKDLWYAAGHGNASSPFSWIYNSSISFLLWGYNNNVSTINYDCGIVDARPTVPSLAINYWNCNNVVIEQGSNCTPAVPDPHMYFVNWKYKTAGYLNPGRYVENDGVWDLRNITLVAQWACESGYQMNSANATCEPCNNNEVWVDGICQPCAYRTQPNADGTACEACNDNDLWVDGICQPCEPGAQLNEYGTACVLCVEGQHIEKGQCVDDVIECDTPNATHAVRTWSEAVRGYSSCRVIDCMDGYHLESNTCVLDDQSCSVANGSGRREWNTKTNQWEICQIIDCDPGFELVGDECAECSNRLDENGDVAVSSYVSGCQIASCMYQGQKYILDGDECKLICKNQEDGTGAMFWDDNVKKCIRTCNPGYKMW